MAEIRILYAEDNEQVRKMFGMLIAHSLREHNLSIDTCENGRELLEKADPSRYHIYVTDHNMQEVTGLEDIKELRKRGDQTPALLISGGIDNLLEYQTLERVAYLAKPPLINDLSSTLKKLLNGHLNN